MDAREDLVRLDYGYCTSEGLDGAPAGVSEEWFQNQLPRAQQVMATLAAWRKAGRLGFLDLPAMADDDLAEIETEAARLRTLCDTLVVLGIGGSALGATAVDMALAGSFRHAFGRGVGDMRLFVADNADPRFFGRLLEGLDLRRTAFNVVSKSGTTAETMSQYLVAKELLAQALGPEEACRRLVFTTDPRKGVLREIAGREPIVCLPVPENVGGRYSVLSAVGLLPLACAGHDIRALLAGAAAMAGRCLEPAFAKNPALVLAHLATHYFAVGRNVLVMMPYASDLFGLAQWFAQLWAESLGKARDAAGNEVHLGQTPVAAVGATDQHSQLQLYMEGPQDKLLCFLTLEDYGQDLEIPAPPEGIEALAYLGGQTMGRLIAAEATATAAALASQGRPSLRLGLPRLDEHVLGQVMMLLMVATVAAGALWQIDPLDQPGVELGKRLTYGLMGRPGFEEEAGRLAEIAGRGGERLA